MIDRELQLKYLMLEDSYRKLEERVSKLEVSLSLKSLLGVQEQLKNTSISLFLLRKDRERLAKELGFEVSEYQSVKSLGEAALEELIYDCRDVLEGVAKAAESSFSPVLLDISEGVVQSEGIQASTKKKEPAKRGRKAKAVVETQVNLSESVGLKSEEATAKDMENVIKTETVQEQVHIDRQEYNKDVLDLNSMNELLSAATDTGNMTEHSKTVIEQKVPSKTEVQGILEGFKSSSKSSIDNLNTGEVATDSFKELDAAINMWS